MDEVDGLVLPETAPGRRGRLQGAIGTAVRLVLGSIFLWAGLSKAFDRQSVLLAVDAYRMLPEVLVGPVATALPWIEIAVGATLLCGFMVRGAAVGACLLSAAFLVALGQAKARGLPIDCGCFGGSGPGEGITWWDITRDVPLLLAGAYLALRPRGPWQLDTVLFEEDVHAQDHREATT